MCDIARFPTWYKAENVEGQKTELLVGKTYDALNGT